MSVAWLNFRDHLATCAGHAGPVRALSCSGCGRRWVLLADEAAADADDELWTERLKAADAEAGETAGAEEETR